MNINRYILTTIAILFCLYLPAQTERYAGTPKENTGVIRNLANKGYKITMRAGLNIGGTTPLPVPSEVKSINSFDPGMNLGIGVDIEKMFTKNWGVQAGVRLENKGMETDVTVENYHTRLMRDGDQTEGNYTGKESTNVSYSLFTIPILARYRFNKYWAVSLGPYISYALKHEFTGVAADGYMRTLRTDPITGLQVPTGSKIEIPADNPATYDFSSDMRRLQWGIEAGIDWQCFKHFMIFAHLDWGMNDTFKSSFKETITFTMYPIYGALGFGYTF